MFAAVGIFACGSPSVPKYTIADDKSYEASLFRQNCAVCHGREGEGTTTEAGLVVPSLRSGNFKFHTQNEIFNQITNGGNGMTPFADQLTDRERRMLASFVFEKLRAQPK